MKPTHRIGIDLGGTKIEIVILDGAGQIIFRRRIKSPQGNYQNTVSALKKLVLDAEKETGFYCTVGIGIPGTISPATGLVKNANSTWLIGEALQKDLGEALKREVRIENDANCFAVSEANDGAGEGQKTVFGVILGTGVGGGFVIDGKSITGNQAIAGEWGHNNLPWPTEAEFPGDKCYCGRRGCIERWLSGPALAKHFDPTGNTTSQEISLRYDQGDEAAVAYLNLYAGRLAKALASIINVIDPDVIVLGGGVSNIQMIYTVVPELWGEWVFSDTVTTKLVQNKHGDSSGVRGAAWLWE